MMIDYLARSNYLREVQRTFGGSGNLDMMGLLSQALSVAIPLAVVGLLWRYRQIILFTCARAVSRLLTSQGRRIVENYLVSRMVHIEVFLYAGGEVGRKLCDARVASITGGKMELNLINAGPSVAKLKNKQVICFTKPFSYSGKRMNAFITIVKQVHQKGIVIKDLTLMTPVRYRDIIRRRHSRQRVAREGAVRLKVWNSRKVNSFWMVRPDLQTVNNPARYGSQTRVVVENVSAGGLRMFIVNPKGTLPPLQKGNHLILRVSIWNPKSKKYTFFTAMGTIRSRFSGKGGAIGLGIQFTSEGNKVGNQYLWKSVQGEIKTLAEFLSQLEG